MKSLRKWVPKPLRHRLLRNKPSPDLAVHLDPIAEHKSEDPASPRRTDIPTEMLLEVFLRLSILDLLRCRLVSRHFQHVIDDSPAMQYKLELHTAGYVNNEAPGLMLGVADRLELLRREQSCWKTPRLAREPVTVDWTHTVHERYYGNLWLSRSRDPDSEDLCWLDNIRCVSFERTPEGTLAFESWTLSFDYSFLVFEADPTRNVLFLLESLDSDAATPLLTLRIRQVSLLDGTLIPNGTFTVDIDRYPDLEHYIASHAALICIITSETHDTNEPTTGAIRMTVVRRSTGEVVDTIIRHRKGSVLYRVHIADPHCILLHLLEPKGRYTTEVHALKYDTEAGRYRMYHAATFEYPLVRPDLSGTELNVFVTCQNITRLGPPPPFAPEPASSVTFIRRTYSDYSQGGWMRVTHIVLLSVFIAAAEAFDPRSRAPRKVPWNEWGPFNAHSIFDDSGNFDRPKDILVLSGFKVLFSDYTLLDFNPAIIAQTLQSAKQTTVSKHSLQKYTRGHRSATGKLASRLKFAHRRQPDYPNVQIPGLLGGIVRQPTVIPSGKWLLNDVVSALSYREITLSEDPGDNTERGTFLYGCQLWFAFTPQDTMPLSTDAWLVQAARAMYVQHAGQ